MVDGFLARGDISQETERTLNRLIGLPDDDFNANVDPYDDNVKANLRKALKLTKGIPRIELARAGFLKPPQEALANYVRDMVKYVEWQRAIKDENGNILENNFKVKYPGMNFDETFLNTKIINEWLNK